MTHAGRTRAGRRVVALVVGASLGALAAGCARNDTASTTTPSTITPGSGAAVSAPPEAGGSSTTARGAKGPNAATPKCAGFDQVELDLYIATQSTTAPIEKKGQIAATMQQHAQAFIFAVPELKDAVTTRATYAIKVMQGTATDADRSADQTSFNQMADWKQRNGC